MKIIRRLLSSYSRGAPTVKLSELTVAQSLRQQVEKFPDKECAVFQYTGQRQGDIIIFYLMSRRWKVVLHIYKNHVITLDLSLD